MEARIYFRRNSVKKRIEKAGITPDREEGTEFSVYGGGSYYIRGDKRDIDLAYVKIAELVDLEVPKIFRGLKIVKMSIFDTLSKEENPHIRQGLGREGKTKWSITFDDEKFEIPNTSPYSSAHAFRSLIKIRIKSDNLQSAQACYEKIRKGEMTFNWKGDVSAPSHCGLSVASETEY